MDDQPQPAAAASLATRLSPRYVGVLLASAVLILAVGAVLRPKAERVVTIPTSELATLPERSQRRELREIADYVAQRAADLADAVVYLPAIGASGLRVDRDSVLSVADRDGTPDFVVLAQTSRDSSGPAPPAAGPGTPATQWAVVVARSIDGALLSVAGLAGSTAPLQCGELALRELSFGAHLSGAFAGGGLFDLDGHALALAVPCAGRVALVPLPDVTAARRTQATLEFQLWSRLGFRAAPATRFRPALPGADSGAAVAEIRAGGPADRAGLRPGDIIVGTGDQAVAAPADLERLMRVAAPIRLALDRRRAGVTLTVEPDTAGARRIEVAAPTGGLVLAAVGDGSRAARAGLRPGDRILQVGLDAHPTPASLARALATGGALFVVDERDGRRRGVVIP